MKRIISILLFICISVCSINISFASAETDDVLVAAPILVSGIEGEAANGVVVGLNSGVTYVSNRSESDINIEFSATVKTDGVTDFEQAVAANIKSGESRRLNIGFNITSEMQTVDFAVKNTDANYIYTDFTEIPVNEDFKISYTNAINNMIFDNDIIFEFNSIIEEDINNILLLQNGESVEFDANTTSMDNGMTRLFLTPRTTLLTNTNVKLVLPRLTDIFGRSIAEQEFLFKTADVKEEYKIYQKSKVYAQAGIGGFVVLADFDSNTPQNVYFARTTVKPEREADLPFMSSSIAMVIDPNGNIAASYDFSDIPTGKRNIVLEIPYAAEGVWQFKFTSGRTGDILEIGLPDANNWGVRGETALGVTETTPKSSYIYVPEKVNNLYVGTTGTAVSVYDSENNLQMTTEETNNVFAKSEGEIQNIENENIYRLEMPDSFNGGIIVDYAPSLMCPTEEMAQSLKGGWLDADGVLVQGSIQKKARELLIKYINEKSFDIDCEKPTYTRGTLKHPEAEALFFGTNGAISNVKGYSEKQNFDITSPYCGSFVSADTATWEDGTYPTTTSVKAFSGLVNMDGELNAFYHHEGLINRTAISILASLVMLSEDVMIKDNETSGNYPLTHGNFYFSYTSRAYMRIRDFLDEEARTVIDNAIIQMSYKQGDMRGLGPSNQWFYTMNGVAAAAYSTENAFLKRMLNRHIEGVINGPQSSKGQSAAGYFIEGGGCDGDYHNLSRDLFFEVYKMMQEKDPDNKYLSSLKSMIQKNLEFNSLFLISGSMPNTNAATSRKTTNMGVSTHTTYTKIMDEFPLAKRRFELFGTLNSEAKANERLHKYVGLYDSYSDRGVPGEIYEFEAYKNVWDAESTLLPFEQTSGIWEKDGIIAVKHNGLYMNIFYTVPENTVLPDMSFMGGGMSLLWADGVEGVSSSRKHLDYSSITSYDQILASCVFGKKTDGSVFTTGKEKAELEWLEDNKKFRIYGTTPDEVDISWTYTLTDTGIVCDVVADGDTEEMWVNIPISKADSDAVLTHKAGELKYSFNDSYVSFEWDKSAEYYVTELESMRYLRIKLQSGAASVNIEHNTEPQTEDIEIVSYNLTEGIGYTFERVDSYGDSNIKGIEVDISNNSQKPRQITLIYAVYSEQGKLLSIQTNAAELNGASDISLSVGAILPQNSAKVKVMIWENFGTLRSYGVKEIDL